MWHHHWFILDSCSGRSWFVCRTLSLLCELQHVQYVLIRYKRSDIAQKLLLCRTIINHKTIHMWHRTKAASTHILENHVLSSYLPVIVYKNRYCMLFCKDCKYVWTHCISRLIYFAVPVYSHKVNPTKQTAQCWCIIALEHDKLLSNHSADSTPTWSSL